MRQASRRRNRRGEKGKTYKGGCSDDPNARLSVQECEMARSRLGARVSCVVWACLAGRRSVMVKEWNERMDSLGEVSVGAT